MGGSVVVQARVPAEIAEQLPSDIAALGLDGTSDAVREGLLLLHRKARMVALGQSYDSFYGHEPASVSDVTAALYPED